MNNPFTPEELRLILYFLEWHVSIEEATDNVQAKALLVEAFQHGSIKRGKRRTKSEIRYEQVLTKLQAMPADDLPPLPIAANAAFDLIG